jgi:hypothetical protein
MATIKDYVFDNMARIGNDTCGLQPASREFFMKADTKLARADATLM